MRKKEEDDQMDPEYFKYEIFPSTEEGFNINTCFQEEYQRAQEGYQKDSDYYFDSYSHYNIHEEMLKDRVRTSAYQNAISKNKHLFDGKTVLDVGCGTGILSIFAAKAGAKHVYGVDNANIALFAQKIVQENGLKDKVTIIKGKIEEIQLPVEKVDVIISEWMGYFLLYESMLDCVLIARDKFLAPGGLMFPDRAILFVATIEDEEYRNQKLDFWNNVYGVDMKCIRNWAQKEPLIEGIDRKQINGESCAILDINLLTVKATELDFSSQYKIKIIRNDYVHGLIAWFEVYFSQCHMQMRLSTSPYSKDTHWKQTIFYFKDSIPVYKGDKLEGSIAVKKNPTNQRDLDIKISVYLNNKIKNFKFTQYFKLN